MVTELKKATTLLIVCVICCAAFIVGCTSKKDNVIGITGLTKAQKQEDVEYLMDKLSEYYVYQDIHKGSPSSLLKCGTAECETMIKKIVNTKNDRDYISELFSFLNALGNPHTQIALEYADFFAYFDETFTTEKEYYELQEKWLKLQQGYFSLPFSHTASNKEMELVVSHSQIPGIAVGDKILSINGIPPKTFYKNTVPSNFPQELKVKLLLAENKENELTFTAANTISLPEECTTKILDSGMVAYMRIQSLQPDYLDNIDSFFAEVSEKNIANIILDLRGNGGGDFVVAEKLTAYLSGQKANSTIRIDYDNTLVSLHGKQEESDWFNYYFSVSPKDDFLLNADVDIENYDGFNFTAIIKSGNCEPYKGKVYILQDRGSYSNAPFVIQNLKAANAENVTTVGIATGGTGAQGGKFVMLPKSKLPIRISNQMLVDKNGGVDEIVGIMPDYEVEPASADNMSEFYWENPNDDFFTSEADPQFQKVMELIE